MATFDHICWTKSKAKNRILRGLSRALSIAITINEFFFWVTLLNYIEAWLNTDTLMVYGTIRTHWCAYVTFSHHKAWWTDWEPLIITLLAVSTLLLLSIASPKGQRFLTPSVNFFKEFWTIVGVVKFVNIITNDTGFIVACMSSSMPTTV